MTSPSLEQFRCMAKGADALAALHPDDALLQEFVQDFKRLVQSREEKDAN